MTIKIDAKLVVTSMTMNTKDKASHLYNFLKTANSNKLQGPAMVSYFTELNKVARKKGKLSKEAADRFEKLPDLIDKEVEKTPELAAESQKFLVGLKSAYPKTLDKRLSIASQGAVTSDRVEPKSRFKKLLIYMSQILKNE